MMRRPPMMAAAENASPSGLAQSTMATMKTVSLMVVSCALSATTKRKETHRAATEESTGEVREMRTRKDPEKAGGR